ncbi:MAG: TIGR02444 family protein [Parvularcula sp.]|jgi:uncharacterized protein (TIGR02444 family)|nr:TIGR02444 family protein [Parvularcula sp.]
MSPDEAADQFWTYSVTLYDREEVRHILLTLQNRFQYNVNVVLWCCWSAAAGWALTEEEVRDITRQVDDFTTYGVERLREVRRFAASSKPGFPEASLHRLYDKLLDVELEAERLVQYRLAAETAALPSPARGPAGDFKATACRHFQSVAPSLEKPILLADDAWSGAPAALFDKLLDLVTTETAE